MQPAKASGTAVAIATRASIFRTRGAFLGKGILGMGVSFSQWGRNDWQLRCEAVRGLWPRAPSATTLGKPQLRGA